MHKFVCTQVEEATFLSQTVSADIYKTFIYKTFIGKIMIVSKLKAIVRKSPFCKVTVRGATLQQIFIKKDRKITTNDNNSTEADAFNDKAGWSCFR